MLVDGGGWSFNTSFNELPGMAVEKPPPPPPPREGVAVAGLAEVSMPGDRQPAVEAGWTSPLLMLLSLPALTAKLDGTFPVPTNPVALRIIPGRAIPVSKSGARPSLAEPMDSIVGSVA